MTTCESFCRLWFFLPDRDTSNPRAYPGHKPLVIGPQGGGLFMMAWSDVHRDFHVVVGLYFDEDKGILVSLEEGAVDLFSGMRWRIRIEKAEEGGIRGMVMLPGGAESHLSGTWGAEENPPEEETKATQAGGGRISSAA